MCVGPWRRGIPSVLPEHHGSIRQYESASIISSCLSLRSVYDVAPESDAHEGWVRADDQRS